MDGHDSVAPRQVLAQQNQWSDAQAIAAKIAADFPNFQQQYEVDYLLGRCLANQADFEGARRAYNRVVRSPAGAKTETAAMAQWMIGETLLPPEELRGRPAGILAAGNPLCVSHLAGGGPVAGRQVPPTTGRGQRGGRPLPTHFEELPQHDFCRRGRGAAEKPGEGDFGKIAFLRRPSVGAAVVLPHLKMGWQYNCHPNAVLVPKNRATVL